MNTVNVYVVKVKNGLCFSQPEAYLVKCFVGNKIRGFLQLEPSGNLINSL